MIRLVGIVLMLVVACRPHGREAGRADIRRIRFDWALADAPVWLVDRGGTKLFTAQGFGQPGVTETDLSSGTSSPTEEGVLVRSWDPVLRTGRGELVDLVSGRRVDAPLAALETEFAAVEERLMARVVQARDGQCHFEGWAASSHWTTPPTQCGVAMVAVSGGVVYARVDESLAAYDGNDGTLRWRGDLGFDPVVGGAGLDLALLPTSQDTLGVVGLRNGQPVLDLWSGSPVTRARTQKLSAPPRGISDSTRSIGYGNSRGAWIATVGRSSAGRSHPVFGADNGESAWSCAYNWVSRDASGTAPQNVSLTTGGIFGRPDARGCRVRYFGPLRDGSALMLRLSLDTSELEIIRWPADVPPQT